MRSDWHCAIHFVHKLGTAQHCAVQYKKYKHTVQVKYKKRNRNRKRETETEEERQKEKMALVSVVPLSLSPPPLSPESQNHQKVPVILEGKFKICQIFVRWKSLFLTHFPCCVGMWRGRYRYCLDQGCGEVSISTRISTSNGIGISLLLFCFIIIL